MASLTCLRYNTRPVACVWFVFCPGGCTLITQHELLDTAIQQVGNRYLATMLIAKRIRQLYHGAPERLSRQEGESNFSIAT